MHVDVVDVCGRQPCIVQGVFHHIACPKAFRVWRCNVVGICGHAATHHFAINFGAAGTGMLKVFQDDAAAAFTKDKSVPCGVEGT